MPALTDKEKDFLLKAMLADIGVTFAKNSRSSYIYFLKRVGIFRRKKVIGRCDPEFEDYEMYGFPYTNSKIHTMISERYNVDPKIIFNSDYPCDDIIIHPCMF
jgi:hypothetical protein